MLVILTLCVLGFLAYSNSFHNSFHFDDFPQIVNNPAIKDIHNLHNIWGGIPTRFVSFFSFALNYHWGALDVRGYHALSLLIHVLTSILVYWLALLILQSPLMRTKPIAAYASWIAFFSGAIFLLHPIQTEPVNYIFQRSVLLAAFFYLASLTLFAKVRLCQEEGKSQIWIFYYIGALLAALLSMFSKEMSASLPLTIVLYEWFFFKSNKKGRWKLIVPFFLAALVIPFLTIHSLNFTNIPKAAQDYSGVSVREYFLTQFRVKVTYLRLLFIPFRQTVVYDYPTVKSIFEIPVVLSALFLLFILTLAFKLKDTFPMLSFGIFWFFITLLPESSVIPIINYICEYRLYLPMAGFSLFLSSGMFYLFKGKKGALAIRALFLCIAVYSVMTYQRNKIWSDEFTLWDDTVHKSPASARAFLNRGSIYQVRGDLDHALADYNMAIGLGNTDVVTFSNRGLIFEQKGDLDLALANFNLAIKVNPSYSGTYFNRGLLYKKEGRFDLAEADFSKALAFRPDDAILYELRAETYFLNKEYDNAWADIRRVQQLGVKGRPWFWKELIKASGKDPM